MDKVDGSDSDVPNQENEEDEEEEEQQEEDQSNEHHSTTLEVSEQGLHETSKEGPERSTGVNEGHVAADIPLTEDMPEDGGRSQNDSTSGLLGVCERIVSDAAAEMTEALRAESMSPRTSASSATKARIDSDVATSAARSPRAEDSSEHKPHTKMKFDNAAPEKVSAKAESSGVKFAAAKTEPSRKRKAGSKDRLGVPHGKISTSSPRSPGPSSPRASRAAKSEADVSLRSIVLQPVPDETLSPEDFPLEKDLGASKIKKLIARMEKFIEPKAQESELQSPKHDSESKKGITSIGSSVEVYRKSSTLCMETVQQIEARVQEQPPDKVSQIQEDAYAALQELTNYTHQVQDDISATTDKNEETKKKMDKVAGEFRHMREALRKNRVQLKQMEEDIQNLQKNTKKAMTESIEELKERTRSIMRDLGDETKTVRQVDGRSRSNTRRPHPKVR